MKKITLLCLVIVAFAFSWQSQAQYFTEGFEGATFPPTDWMLTQTNVNNTWFHQTTSGANGSVNSAQCDYDAALGAQDESLTTPVFDLSTATNPRLKFWFMMSYYWGVDPNPNYDLVVSINDGTTTTQLWTEADQGVFENFTWYEVTIDLSAYAGSSTLQLILNYNGADGAQGNFDEILVEETPTCEAPNALTATNITETSADLGWTELGTATNWNLEWGTSGFTQGSGTLLGTTTNPYPLAGLTAVTDYEFYVQSDCDASGSTGMSSWAGPFAFQTLPPPAANDECADAIDLDTFMNSDGTCVVTYVGSNIGATNSATEVAPSTECTDADPAPFDIWFSVTVPATGGFIYDDIVVPGISSIVEVYTGTCGSLTALIPVNCTNASDEKTFGGLTPGSTVYLRYWDYGSNDEGTFEFCIKEVPTCPEPLGMAAANVTQTSADLTWTENGIATAWNLEWKAGADFMPGNMEEDDSAAVTTTPAYNAIGLTPETTYYIYYQSDCGGETSPWVGPFVGATLSPPPACGGNFYDTGGLGAGYSASESITTTILPDVSGEVVTITFTYVDIETSTGTGTQDGCWDYLTIYDGPDATYPVLAQTLCGEESGDGGVPSVPASELNVGASFTSTDASGALTIVFTSDSSVQETGWIANITCAPLGVEDSMFIGFKYFPNPVNGTLSLRAQNIIDQVAVYNMLGQEVIKVTPNTMSNDLDMSTLSSGSYFIKVNINGAVENFKIIKE